MTPLATHNAVAIHRGVHGQSWDVLEGEVWGPAPHTDFYSIVSKKRWRQVSPYFSPSELASKGDGYLLVHLPMLMAFNQVRKEGKITAHTPNSFYRSPPHNKNEGGSKRSRHMFSAVDVPRSAIPNVSAMLKRAAELGFNGFGRYNSFIHMDWRARPAIFPSSARASWPNW